MNKKLYDCLMKLVMDRRAFTPVIGLVIAVVAGFFALAVLLPTGLITIASLNATIASMTTVYTGAVKTQTIALISNIFAGFSLMGITPLVMAAGSILTILIVSFSVIGLRQQD